MVIFSIGLFTVPQSFADHGYGEIIDAYIDKGEFAGFVPGETVQISGLVQDAVHDVIIEVQDLRTFNTVAVLQTSVDESGSFSTSIGTSSLDYGEYFVIVSYGSGDNWGMIFTVVVAPNTIFNALGSSTPGCEAFCFIPSVISVNVGDTITWTNPDNAAHTATSGTPSDGGDGIWDSGLIMAGGSFSMDFEDFDQGTYPYFCMVHPWMIGSIIVNEGGTSTPADIVPPTVLVPDDITLQTEDQNGSSATFNPQAIDNIDELITPTCSPASGSVFAIGTTEVVCTATDSSGNTASNSFNVIIEYTGSLIPDWVKNVAGFWHDGSINDASFLEGISYLIQNDIIIVPTTEAGTGGGEVPDWVKNTAGWWANDEIDDDTFVNAITYLIQQGLIQV